MTDERRRLNFSSLSGVMSEVDRLLPGHRTLGAWSLAQICNHLSAAIVLSVDGFPVLAPWVLRKTIGPLVGRRIFKTGRMPDGFKIPKKFEPKPDLDVRAEAEALRASIQLFSRHPGPFSCHPFIGPLSREQWERFHTIHGAHHLGFVLPGSVPG